MFLPIFLGRFCFKEENQIDLKKKKIDMKMLFCIYCKFFSKRKHLRMKTIDVRIDNTYSFHTGINKYLSESLVCPADYIAKL